MATLTVDELIKAAEQLPQMDLEALTTQVLTLHAKRNASNLPAEEADLLMKINQGLPHNLQKRYQALMARRQAETMTEQEHIELIRLTNQIEQHDAKRLTYLTELARIRKVSLAALLDELGIQPIYT